jgi:hypothetical protein
MERTPRNRGTTRETDSQFNPPRTTPTAVRISQGTLTCVKHPGGPLQRAKIRKPPPGAVPTRGHPPSWGHPVTRPQPGTRQGNRLEDQPGQPRIVDNPVRRRQVAPPSTLHSPLFTPHRSPVPRASTRFPRFSPPVICRVRRAPPGEQLPQPPAVSRGTYAGPGLRRIPDLGRERIRQLVANYGISA